jgi:hypothetical protein
MNVRRVSLSICLRVPGLTAIYLAWSAAADPTGGSATADGVQFHAIAIGTPWPARVPVRHLTIRYLHIFLKWRLYPCLGTKMIHTIFLYLDYLSVPYKKNIRPNRSRITDDTCRNTYAHHLKTRGLTKTPDNELETQTNLANPESTPMHMLDKSLPPSSADPSSGRIKALTLPRLLSTLYDASTLRSAIVTRPSQISCCATPMRPTAVDTVDETPLHHQTSPHKMMPLRGRAIPKLVPSFDPIDGTS